MKQMDYIFEQQPFYQTAVKNLLSLMVIELVRREMAVEWEFYQLSIGQIPVHEVLSARENHCKEISLCLLAKKYGYNESYLSRMIRKITGQSFLQLLTKSRCKRAIPSAFVLSRIWGSCWGLAGFWGCRGSNGMDCILCGAVCIRGTSIYARTVKLI